MKERSNIEIYSHGSRPWAPTMQKELGIGANSLGRTAIRLFEESTSK